MHGRTFSGVPGFPPPLPAASCQCPQGCKSPLWTSGLGRKWARWKPDVLMGGSGGEDLLMNRMWVGKESIKKDFILTKQEHLKNTSYVSLLFQNYPLSSSSSSLTPHWTVQMELAADQGPPSAVRSWGHWSFPGSPGSPLPMEDGEWGLGFPHDKSLSRALPYKLLHTPRLQSSSFSSP